MNLFKTWTLKKYVATGCSPLTSCWVEVPVWIRINERFSKFIPSSSITSATQLELELFFIFRLDAISRRYSVTGDPLLRGSFHDKAMECEERFTKTGVEGGSGTPGPLSTSKDVDHAPTYVSDKIIISLFIYNNETNSIVTPILLFARTWNE